MCVSSYLCVLQRTPMSLDCLFFNPCPRSFSINPPKTNMTIAEKSTMNKDVFPIENGDFPLSHLSELRVINSQKKKSTYHPGSVVTDLRVRPCKVQVPPTWTPGSWGNLRNSPFVWGPTSWLVHQEVAIFEAPPTLRKSLKTQLF